MKVTRFRVWNKIKKEWVHAPGYEVNLFGESILLGGFMREISVEGLNDCEVLQFTQIKDSKGEDIYEGNIISYTEKLNEHGESQQLIGVVKYDTEVGSFGIVGPNGWEDGDFWGYFIDRTISNIKIIGNIFENKKLCQEK